MCRCWVNGWVYVQVNDCVGGWVDRRMNAWKAG